MRVAILGILGRRNSDQTDVLPPIAPLPRYPLAFPQKQFFPNLLAAGAGWRAQIRSTVIPTKPTDVPGLNPFVSGHGWSPPMLRATSGCLPHRVPAFRQVTSSATHLFARAVSRTVRKVLRKYLRFESPRAHDCECGSRNFAIHAPAHGNRRFWQTYAPAKARNFGAPSNDLPPGRMWR